MAVAVALGIFSFGITAVLALFSVSLSNSRESSDDTRFAAMLGQVCDALRAKPFQELDPATAVFYFDRDGAPQAKAAASSYQCTVALAPKSGSVSSGNSRLELQLVFTSPSGALRTTYASIASYQ